MTEINHFAISSILNSEIVGRSKFGHGQLGSLEDAQRYFDLLALTESPSELHRGEEVDTQKVIEAFRAVRNARGDRGSPDLYVADPDRNALFLAKCRELGLKGSDYVLNKKLMNARRDGRLPGLHSVRTSINYEDYAFACEFAATELKYKTGASIDDIVCDPALASRFDAIARKLSPGLTPFHYRWAILSIRKAGRTTKWKSEYRMPKLQGNFRLLKDPLDALPETRGVYLLFEGERQRPLYARSTERLRQTVELHRKAELLAAILDKFWQPNPDDFLVSFARVPAKKLLKPIERKLLEEKRPIFNVPRVA